MKILWMPLAMSQVQEVVDYIARDKPEVGARWAASVFDLVAALPPTPQRGRVVPEIGREEIRELLHGHYRIIYRLDPDKISVLSVRQGYRLLASADIPDI